MTLGKHPLQPSFPPKRIAAVALAALVFCFALGAAQPPVSDILDQARTAFDARYQPAQLAKAIALYESLLDQLSAFSTDRQALVLNRLSQLYYEQAEADGAQGDANRQRFEKGKGYGLRSLELNPQFKAKENGDFSAAAKAVSDSAALLWTANNWGTLLGFLGLGGANQLGQVRALFERCLEVDESYWGASCHSALGALLATTPSFLGGNFDQAKEHLNRAVKLAPDYLTNHTAVAEFLGFTHDLFGKVNGVRDRSLVQSERQFVLDAPIGDWPFWNRLAQTKAQALLDLLKKY